MTVQKFLFSSSQIFPCLLAATDCGLFGSTRKPANWWVAVCIGIVQWKAVDKQILELEAASTTSNRFAFRILFYVQRKHCVRATKMVYVFMTLNSTKVEAHTKTMWLFSNSIAPFGHNPLTLVTDRQTDSTAAIARAATSSRVYREKRVYVYVQCVIFLHFFVDWQSRRILHVITLCSSIGVSPWSSCLRRWLGSLVYARARGPSSKPSYGAHWHGPTQPTTWAFGGSEGKAATERR